MNIPKTISQIQTAQQYFNIYRTPHHIAQYITKKFKNTTKMN